MLGKYKEVLSFPVNFGNILSNILVISVDAETVKPIKKYLWLTSPQTFFSYAPDQFRPDIFSLDLVYIKIAIIIQRTMLLKRFSDIPKSIHDLKTNIKHTYPELIIR